MDNSAERKEKKPVTEKKEFRVNIMYGDKALAECMETVIRRLLVKVMEADSAG